MPNIIAAAQRILEVAHEDSAEFAITCYHDAADVAQALVDITSQLRTIRDVLRRDTLSAQEATEFAAAMLGGLIAKLGGDGDE